MKSKLFYFRRPLVKAIDLISVVVALYSSFLLRLLDPSLSGHVSIFFKALGLLIVAYAVGARLFSVGQARWQHLSSSDVNRLLMISVFMLGVLVFFSFLFAEFFPLPRSVAIFYGVMQLALLIGTRYFYRSLVRWQTQRYTHDPSRPSALVFGQGMEVENFLRSTMDDKNRPFNVIGLISEDSTELGLSILNVPYLGEVKNIDLILTQLDREGRLPRQLIVSNRNLLAALDKEEPSLISVIRSHGVVISRFEIASVEVGSEVQKITPIDVQDLLFRDVVHSRNPQVAELINGKRVLVTGGGGSIGLELCNQIAAMNPANLTVLDHSEYNLYQANLSLTPIMEEDKLHFRYCNIRERDTLRHVMKDARPQLVFHAAAMKHVPIVESDPFEGVMTNIVGSRNVADLCEELEVESCLFISTDKAVNPTNFMGCTKRVSEMYCQALNEARTQLNGKTKFVAVRFGNVLGSSGSVVPLFEKQIRDGGPVTVTHKDMTRYFMTIREAVSLVLQAFTYNYKTSSDDCPTLFVLDMGRPIRIYDLAERMIQLAGLQPGKEIDIVISSIRSGEKLEEELFYETEKLDKIDGEDFFHAKASTIELKKLNELIDELQDACQHRSFERMSNLIERLVPEFRPYNR